MAALTSDLNSPKSAKVAFILCLLFGSLGVHRFYVGKIWTGLLMLLTLGGLGLWVLIDLILIADNYFRDKQQRTLHLIHQVTPLKKGLMIALAVILGFIIFMGSLISLTWYSTPDLAIVAKKQIHAFKTGHLQKAYTYTSTEFQIITSFNTFADFINHNPVLKENKSFLIKHQSVDNDEGNIAGIVEAEDGEKAYIEYNIIKEQGGWKILGIKLTPLNALVQKLSTNPPNIPPKSVELTQLYLEMNKKFAIAYPGDWIYENYKNNTLIFSGQESTPAYYSTVNIHVIPLDNDIKGSAVLTELLDDFVTHLDSSASNIKVLDRGQVELPQNPKRFFGDYLFISYDYKNEPIKQLQFLITSRDSHLIYALSYISPADRYDDYLPIAKAMFESWAIY